MLVLLLLGPFHAIAPVVAGHDQRVGVGQPTSLLTGNVLLWPRLSQACTWPLEGKETGGPVKISGCHKFFRALASIIQGSSGIGRTSMRSCCTRCLNILRDNDVVCTSEIQHFFSLVSMRSCPKRAVKIYIAAPVGRNRENPGPGITWEKRG